MCLWQEACFEGKKINTTNSWQCVLCSTCMYPYCGRNLPAIWGKLLPTHAGYLHVPFSLPSLIFFLFIPQITHNNSSLSNMCESLFPLFSSISILLPPLCSHFQWLSLCVSSLRILTKNSRTKYLVFCHTSNTFLTAVFQNSNPSFASTNSKHVPFRSLVFYHLAHRPWFRPYFRSILSTLPPLPASPVLLYWRKDEHHPLNGCKISTSPPLC